MGNKVGNMGKYRGVQGKYRDDQKICDFKGTVSIISSSQIYAKMTMSDYNDTLVT